MLGDEEEEEGEADEEQGVTGEVDTGGDVRDRQPGAVEDGFDVG